MKVLVALDKFKDCFTASEACSIAAKTLNNKYPSWQLECSPLTDGGEGFCEILTLALGGTLYPVRVLDARFREVSAYFGTVPIQNLPDEARRLLGIEELDGKIAVIEMAQASGLEQLPVSERNPWHTNTCGTGQLIREACRKEITHILLGIGGSATNDLGFGALEALGIEFFGEDGPLPRIIPVKFPKLRQIDLESNLLPLPTIHVACDVANPLLGPDGATAVFAPQKGLPDKDLPAMEKALAHAAELLCETKGCKRDTLEEPGTGAAGGIGWGLHVATDATFINGFQLISAWLGLDRKINDADLILTGEGRMDASSTHGKGPWATLQKANKSGKLVHVFAGILTSEILGALPHNVFAHAITPAQMPLEEALANGQKLLEKAVLKI